MLRIIGVILALLSAPAMAQSPGAQSPGAQDAAQGPPLSPAQTALFATPHLAAIHEPLDLEYRFLREEDGRRTVEDRIVMQVRAVHEGGRHDVYPDVLSGDRHIAFPPALGFHGNPLLMFALERDAHQLATATGGAPSWFRNRIRRAFADGATLHETRLHGDGALAEAPALEIEITPFQGEPRAGRYQQQRFVFLLSQAVPGGIAEIRSILPPGEGGGEVVESITFAGTHPR